MPQAAAIVACSCSLSQHISKPGTTSRDHCLRSQEGYKLIPGHTNLEERRKKASFQLDIINWKIIYTFLCHCHHLIFSKYKMVEKQLVPKHLLSLCY